MKIGLWSDSHNFPSLPLMKLSAYHKANGDNVEMFVPLNHYDLVYASKVFSFTPDIEDLSTVNADNLIKNGTGYAITVKDGKEIFDKQKISACRMKSNIFIPTTAFTRNFWKPTDF